MFSRDKIVGMYGWCYLLTALIGILMLVSCVPTTLNSTDSTPARPMDGYTEITSIYKRVSTSSEQTDADLLIQKSRAFIKTYPKFEKVDEVYLILGTTLITFDRAEEAIPVLDELIRYYPLSESVEPGLLTLGLAYDKMGKHDKADVVYGKILNSPKYNEGKIAEAAQQLLQTDISDRKGALSDSSSEPSPTDFIGQSALDFKVVDLTGKSLSLEKYRGQVVLLDFWATWCGPCIAEMPNVKATYAKFKNQKFQIIGISLDNGRAPLEAYIAKEGIAWPQYFDNGGQIANMYQVRAIPTTFLIDGEGVIRKANLRGGALETAVAQLVRENLAQ